MIERFDSVLICVHGRFKILKNGFWNPTGFFIFAPLIVIFPMNYKKYTPILSTLTYSPLLSSYFPDSSLLYCSLSDQ